MFQEHVEDSSRFVVVVCFVCLCYVIMLCHTTIFFLTNFSSGNGGAASL